MTVIAIHGNGGGGFRFSRLKTDFPLLCPTLPGFEGGRVLESYRAYADFLQGLVREVEGPKFLLGTGIGGSLVLEYLQHYPDSVDGVVLHAPVGARLESRWFPRLMSVPGVAFLVKFLISWRLLRPLWLRLFFRNGTTLPTKIVDRFFAAYAECGAFVPMFEWITADWWTGLKPVDIPSCLLWGGRERMLKAEHVQDFKEKLPAATVRIVEHWDHFPMLEQPEEFSLELKAIVRELRG